VADPQDFVNALGRISGKLLSDNLLRNGTDLAFDTDLLYLKVSASPSIGINRDVPVYTLDVNSDANFNDLIVTTQAAIDNIIINAPDQFTTSIGAIQIRPAGVDPSMFHDRLTTSALIFNDNNISSISDQNIVFDPNGTGQFRIEADTNITGDLGVSGNITISGNLSKQGSIFIGDDRFDGEGNLPENDTITFNVDFAQSIIPGEDLTYDLGIDRSDSTPRRWAQAHIPDWTTISTGAWPGSGLLPQAVIVSDQMRLDGVTNRIFGVQSNEDIALLPDTGIVYIERTKWQDSDITNLLDAPLTFAGTGIGYTRFVGDNAFVIPAGNNSQQRATPEVGETRWNTEVGYLECFDGTVWNISTGGGDEVTTAIMEDFGHAYTLMLG
jgi:hypothetical protein